MGRFAGVCVNRNFFSEPKKEKKSVSEKLHDRHISQEAVMVIFLLPRVPDCILFTLTDCYYLSTPFVKARFLK